MRASLVFAPSICLPNQMYGSLPVLAGALRRAGHEPRIVDLNLLAADMLLTEARTERYLGMGREQVSALRGRGQHAAAAAAAAAALDSQEDALRFGPEAKATLRDPARFYDQPSFRRAFWTVVDDLAFFYQLDPIVPPHRATFARDMDDLQRRDPWTPLSDLYEEGLVARVLEGDPGLVAISVAFPEQAVESLRFARRLKKARPAVHVCFGGPLIAQFLDKWLQDGFLLRFADTVCSGDGESAIVELADALQRGSDLARVTNLVWPDSAGKLDLSGLERPMLMPDEVVEAFAASDDVEPASGYFADEFGLRSRLEAGWRAVRAEWDRLPIEEIREWPQSGAYAGKWGVFGFYLMGRRIERNCKICPRTAELVASIPGMVTAGYSVTIHS